MDGISRSRGWDKEIPHCVLPMEQLVLSDKWARNLYSHIPILNLGTVRWIRGLEFFWNHSTPMIDSFSHIPILNLVTVRYCEVRYSIISFSDVIEVDVYIQ